MILIGLGSNLFGGDGNSPVANCRAALALLGNGGAPVRVLRRSPWYRTRPVPVSDQPWYANGVALLETPLPPADLMDRLHAVEQALGRKRSAPNAARVIDLDLLDYDGRVISEPDGLVLPHPRLHRRLFVLVPLRDVAPHWRHPVLGLTAEQLIPGVPADQAVDRLEPADGAPTAA